MTSFSNPKDVFAFVREAGIPYFAGAIFPSEMALFIQLCDETGVDGIVESGRQDGYSTGLLALYGERKEIPVVSVDYEDVAYAERTEACRTRLRRFSRLRLDVGDALERFPAVLRGLKAQRIALLVDGPKGHEAIYLSAAACARAPVALVAHHNTAPTMSWYSHFAFRFPGAQRLEESSLARSTGIEDFRKWERQVVAVDDRGLRGVDDTSLACSRLQPPAPSRSFLTGPSRVLSLRAWVCHLWWAAGCPGGVRTLRLLWRATGHGQ
jgi:predicted O-methyltransferase YrrM